MSKKTKKVVTVAKVSANATTKSEHDKAVEMFKKATRENAYAGYQSKIKLPAFKGKTAFSKL